MTRRWGARLLGLVLVSSTGMAVAADSSSARVLFDKGEFAAAAKEYLALAQKGDAQAQYHLGEMFRRGLGFPQDLDAAKKWLHHAAESGMPQAQFALGRWYRAASEYDLALQWWERAAQQGEIPARAQLKAMSAGMTAIQRARFAKIVGDTGVPGAPQSLDLVVFPSRAVLDFASKSEESSLDSVLSRLTNDSRADALQRTMIAAAQKGDENLIRYVLRQDARLNYTDENGVSALHWSVRTGKIEAVQALLGAKVDINAKDKQNRTVLMWCLLGECKKEMVDTLLLQGVQIDATDRAGYSAAHYAIRSSNNYALQALVAANVKLISNAECEDLVTYATREENKTALRLLAAKLGKQSINQRPYSNAKVIAVRRRAVSLVETMAELGFDFSLPEQTGESALALAKHLGATSVLATLARHGQQVKPEVSVARATPTPNARQLAIVVRLKSNTKAKFSSLNTLAWSGNVLRIAPALKTRQEAQRADETGYSPLMLAVARGNDELVANMKALDVGFDARLPDGRSLLYAAVEANHVQTVKILLDSGAQPRAGERVLGAAIKNRSYDLFTLLLERLPTSAVDSGDLLVAVTELSELGQTVPVTLQRHLITLDEHKAQLVLRRAVQHDRAAVVKSLLTAKPSLYASEAQKRLLLSEAVMSSALNSFQELSARFRWEGEDDFRNTLLHYSARRNEPEIVRTLVARGEKVDAENVAYETPLMIASMYGNTEVIRVLLQVGARIDLKNRSGESAYDLAVAHAHPQIAKLVQFNED